jgi:uncharacterized protein (DUF697 family)
LGTIRSLRKGAGALRPFVNAVRGVERASDAGGAISVLDGEPVTTARLRAILDVSADASISDQHDLLVHAAVAGHDVTLAAAVLAGAKREGRRVLCLLVGSRAERDALEEEILTHPPLEPSNVAHVVSLDDAAAICRVIARVLGDDAVGAARRHAALRAEVADALIATAARRAATVGAVAVLPGADLPAISLIQVRLVAQLAAVHDRPLDSRRVPELVGVLASAFGWRAVARRALATIPVAGFALRGGVAYSATRTVGEAAKVWFTQAGDKADAPFAGLQAAIDGVRARRGGR